MTKQEKIKEAYGDYWCEAKDWITKNGFFNGEAKSLSQLRTKLYRDNNIDITLIDEVQFVRPKTLKGIENNNGWIKIESKNDLPKEEKSYWVLTDENDIVEMEYFTKYKSFTEEGVTHYQEIIKPKLPIY